MLTDGFVVSSIESPVKRAKEFECQVAVLPLLDHKPIITSGYECVLHIHSLAIECKITRLVSEHDKKTGKPCKRVPTFIKNGCRLSPAALPGEPLISGRSYCRRAVDDGRDDRC